MHGFAHSGLANFGKTMDVSERDGELVVSCSSKKRGGRLSSTVVKKKVRRCNYAAGAVAASVRPDLVRAAKARASAITKSQRVRAAAAKKSA